MEAFKIPAAAIQLLALSSAFIPCKTQIAVITPLSYTARLGNVGIFHCAATGSDIISWYINELPSGYPSVRRRGIYPSRQTSINATWIQSSLTIPATWENHGVSIDCAALLDGPQTRGISELATFHVQGPLLPPANLTLEVLQDQTYLILRWNPPSSNESTITMYTVYVNVSHTGAVTHYNTSMRNYTIRNPCSDVSFKVTAWDDVGEGTTATFLSYRHNSTDTELSIPSAMRVSISFGVSGEPKVELSFQIQSNSSHQSLQVCLQSFLVETWSDCSGTAHHQGPYMLEPTIVNSTATLVIPSLPSECHITARVRSQISSSIITFATYGVQEAEISEDSLLGSICITCIFAQGTSAQGCYISLLDNHDSVTPNTTGLRIEREDESLNATGCFENLEGGLYHVAVYDADAGGTVDWQNRALFLTAALNWTTSTNQLNTNKEEILVPTSNLTLQKDNVVSAIAGGVGSAVLLLVVTALILFCVLILRKIHSTTQNMKQSNHDDTDDIEMKKNEIYGQLPQHQIVRNPAYNWWKPRGS